jgi:hypothetical protein
MRLGEGKMALEWTMLLQHDDLLAKDDIFGEERGAGLEDRT